jgi:alpha-tubulin suppressor-like RCC1 family protein
MADVKFVDMAISLQENSFAAAIDARGTLYTWGSNQQG